MKIDRILGKIATERAKAATKTKPGEKFGLRDGEAALEVTEATTSSRMSSVDALFLNLERGREKNRKLVERGNNLLDRLESIKTGILAGNLSRDTLTGLSERLADFEPTAEEPLRTILLEIETRVKVELAKFAK